MNRKVKMLLEYICIPLIIHGFGWMLFFAYRFSNNLEFTMFQNIFDIAGMIYVIVAMFILMPILMIRKAVVNLKELKWDTLQFFVYFAVLIIALSPIILSFLFGMAVGGG
ncbi:MAG TPA: hypothetical protein PLB12_00970 [Candidatus Goldiibacteriota bacterium]|nr:hypothetical protein [Candidatus Goldiibacteriota bacterium]HRQ42905.1 hypothetical protein [Candidatus Goldiibacteriota bacterium]